MAIHETVITLKIRWDDDITPVPPEEWKWNELLDLGGTEDVEVFPKGLAPE